MNIKHAKQDAINLRVLIYHFVAVVVFLGSFAVGDACRACEDTANRAQGFINSNARIAAKDYKQKADRTFDTMLTMFGPKFARDFDGLRENGSWFDSGSAYKVAQLQALGIKRFKAVSLNAQNFFAELLQESFAKAPLKTVPHRIAQGRTPMTEVVRVNHVDISVLETLARVLDIRYVPLVKRFRTGESAGVGARLRDQLESLRQSIVNAHARRVEDGRIATIEGLLQEKKQDLKRYYGKIEILTDSFGPYYYSANRIEVLVTYMDLLKAKGRAYVSLGGEINFRPTDFVVDQGELTASLVQRFPTVFSKPAREDPAHFQFATGQIKITAVLSNVLVIDATDGTAFRAAHQYLRRLKTDHQTMTLHDAGGGFVVPHGSNFTAD